jgi:hypothetical protein
MKEKALNTIELPYTKELILRVKNLLLTKKYPKDLKILIELYEFSHEQMISCLLPILEEKIEILLTKDDIPIILQFLMKYDTDSLLKIKNAVSRIWLPDEYRVKGEVRTKKITCETIDII